MASLFIKDAETAELASRVAGLRGVSKTAAVRDALREAERQLTPKARSTDIHAWLAEYRRANPLPAPTGLKADKAFYDWLSGEEDVDDPFR